MLTYGSDEDKYKAESGQMSFQDLDDCYDKLKEKNKKAHPMLEPSLDYDPIEGTMLEETEDDALDPEILEAERYVELIVDTINKRISTIQEIKNKAKKTEAKRKFLTDYRDYYINLDNLETTPNFEKYKVDYDVLCPDMIDALFEEKVDLIDEFSDIDDLFDLTPIEMSFIIFYDDNFNKIMEKYPREATMIMEKITTVYKIDDLNEFLISVKEVENSIDLEMIMERECEENCLKS